MGRLVGDSTVYKNHACQMILGSKPLMPTRAVEQGSQFRPWVAPEAADLFRRILTREDGRLVSLSQTPSQLVRRSLFVGRGYRKDDLISAQHLGSYGATSLLSFAACRGVTLEGARPAAGRFLSSRYMAQAIDKLSVRQRPRRTRTRSCRLRPP